jgi:glycerol-3-phosphate O-acyltransferase / dihydroxyacetone phosphate acyltransferase
MFWYFLRNTLYYCFQLYFRSIRIVGARHLRQKGPMFIAMNHPNAFMDPISFSTFLFYPRTYYMARGDAFKPGLASFLLQSMGIVPIYRLRDGGYESVKKNLESFKTAYKLLDRRKRIMVFAEGLSVKERRLRPIQKGTAKMSFGYLEQGGSRDLKIVPVGVNYSEPEKFRPYAFYQVGAPIEVKDFYEEYKAQPAQAILKLTAEIQRRMEPLVPSLKHRENDQLIEQLQPILKQQFIEANKLNYRDPAHQQRYWEFIVVRLNELTEKDEAGVEELRTEVDRYGRRLQRHGLRDHLLYRALRQKDLLNFVNLFLLLAAFPLYVAGKLLNFPAWYLAQRIAARKVKNIEFKASVTFGAGAILLNVFFALELLLVWLVWHSWACLAIYAGLKGACGLVALHYSPFRKKMAGALRFRRLKSTDPAEVESLFEQRKKIITFIGEMT